MKRQAIETGRVVRFEIAAQPGSQVFLAGTFNGWNTTATPLKDNPDSGHFKTVLRLPVGTHEYKFVINGAWTVDPQSAHCAPNPYGSLNSVRHV